MLLQTKMLFGQSRTYIRKDPLRPNSQISESLHLPSVTAAEKEMQCQCGYAIDPVSVTSKLIGQSYEVNYSVFIAVTLLN